MLRVSVPNAQYMWVVKWWESIDTTIVVIGRAKVISAGDYNDDGEDDDNDDTNTII